MCGGDVEATWAIDGSCIDGNLVAALNLNPVLPPDCQGMYKSFTGAMSGTVSFAAGSASVDTKLTIGYEVIIDGACAAAYKLAPLDAVNCSDLGPSMVPVIVADQPHTTACALEGSNCHCSSIDEVATKEDRAYAITGSSIKYTGSNFPLDFCVKDGVMHGRQFDASIVSTIFINASRR